MYINNAEELAEALRPRLQDYLVLTLGDRATRNAFECFVHEEATPSMKYNPKTGNETVHCFGCGATHDIFSAAAVLEGLPANGPEWITNTLPALAEKLGVEVSYGEPSAFESERLKYFKLAADIASILAENPATEYVRKRGWSTDYLTVGTIELEALKQELFEQGWSYEDILSTKLVEYQYTTVFGADKVTFVIKDHRGRPCGFVSRNLNGEPKYINSHESPIYNKSNTLLGIDTAIKQPKPIALYVMEGPGDLAAAHATGKKNVVAVCGTAFTQEHLALLKLLGISEIHFCLDWDDAGQSATERLLRNEIKFAKDIRAFVVPAPSTGETDPSDLLNAGHELPESQPALTWYLQRRKDLVGAEELCEEIVPLIAADPSAIRREIFTTSLAEQTGLSAFSITEEVDYIRDNKKKRRQQQMLGAAEKFNLAVEDDPESIGTLLAELTQELEEIDKTYVVNTHGANYQLAKYASIQEQKKQDAKTSATTGFKFTLYKEFERIFSGGKTWSYNSLFYFGGRPNSGKTTTTTDLGVDALLSDPNVMVAYHYTDDNFAQAEPQIKTAMAKIAQLGYLDIATANNPYIHNTEADQLEVLQQVDELFKQLLQEERLTIIDQENGSTLAVLQKHIKYLREKYPDRKLLIIADNTHNYLDYMQLDQVSRMRRISMMQKAYCAIYKCTMFATVEYRKNSAPNQKEMKLPVDDDIADARSLTYLPNAIIHVYNDLNDRQDFAEIFHRVPGRKKLQPRLLLIVSKNKISGWKGKLTMDLYDDTVTIQPYDADQAREESRLMEEARESGKLVTAGGQIIVELGELE